MEEEYRKASESAGFPYDSRFVPFILIKAGKVRWSKNLTDKRAMLAERGGLLLAAWPGKHSTDMFVIDDRALALNAVR